MQDGIMIGLVLLSSSLSAVDLVTVKFQANQRPPLASAKSSTGQKLNNVL
jgi:hypothetical protein